MQNLKQKRIRTARKLKSESGFTLVEVLISIIIFSIAITGIITVAAQGGVNVNAARDKMVANYLADESIELMRGMRDTATLGASFGSGAGWTANFILNFPPTGTHCTAAAPCDIDVDGWTSPAISYPIPANFVACPVDGCPIYYGNDPTDPGGHYGFYVDRFSAGVAPTIYKRKIVVEVLNPLDVRVTTTVTWTEGTTPLSIVASENLFKWN